ncbi:hypothetical protein [Bacteroides sp.]|uniref:hypothetical protein n=1 Tax=Bacteroides sp. TaxID=29523 RepID=UPI002FC6C8AB
MKIVNYKDFDLNLFKLKEKVVHVPTDSLCLMENPSLPDIACYVQIKRDNGHFSGDTVLARVSNLQEYSIKDAAEYFNVPEDFFELKEL